MRAIARVIGSAAVLALLGCDPVAPHVSGIVHVDSDLHQEDYATLELSTGPADGPLDGAKLLTPDVEGVPAERWRLSLSTGGLRPDVAYELGGGIGTSRIKHWRVVAWLSSKKNSDHPAPDEPMGFVDFDAHPCGFTSGRYCGDVENLHLSIQPTGARLPH